MSHPSWVRGLKRVHSTIEGWYETVAPLVGAWIETKAFLAMRLTSKSHPSWVRGLKRNDTPFLHSEHQVAPLVGAWIETCFFAAAIKSASGRTPRGCVD